MVIWLKKDLVRLDQFLLHTFELGTGDKNGIYGSSSTLFSEGKSGFMILQQAQYFDSVLSWKFRDVWLQSSKDPL